MASFEKLKSLLTWGKRPGQDGSQAAPDMDIASPLVSMLPDAEPRADLFARIEADLDVQAAQALPAPSPARLTKLGLVAAGVALGAALTATLWLPLSDRQQIAVRPSVEAPWLALGTVTLHGADLRAFVRAKCRGHSHLFITLHGQAGENAALESGSEIPLMDEAEKILMDCIF